MRTRSTPRETLQSVEDYPETPSTSSYLRYNFSSKSLHFPMSDSTAPHFSLTTQADTPTSMPNFDFDTRKDSNLSIISFTASRLLFTFVVCCFCQISVQDHADLGLCLAEEENKEGVVVRSLIQDGTANKV